MAFAEYGRKELLVFAPGGAAGAVIIAALALTTGPWWLLLLCIVPVSLAGFTLFFFRDPHRTVPEEPSAVVSPADGTITEIAEVEEDSYLGSRARKVGIFLSLLSVHLNRAPYSGKVEYLKYRPGRFLNAGNLESSKVNESNAIGIAAEKCKILLRQISGVIARRIVCQLKEGDCVKTGQRFGMIKFGSRTELYVPVDSGFELRVELGQKVKAGETIIGTFSS
jgi:phosphatidylserine decarboxylase